MYNERSLEIIPLPPLFVIVDCEGRSVDGATSESSRSENGAFAPLSRIFRALKMTVHSAFITVFICSTPEGDWKIRMMEVKVL